MRAKLVGSLTLTVALSWLGATPLQAEELKSVPLLAPQTEGGKPLMQAIKERRSVRHYKPDPVKPEDLQSVLEAARMAPSWANTQTWRLIVVKDKGLKAQLSAAQM
jgi:hypothetical protein